MNETETMTTPDFPRRIRRDQWTPAERAIGAAMEAVEAAGADVRLTDAVVLLQAARDSVADYVDGVMVRRAVSVTTAAQEAEVARLREKLTVPVSEACEYEGRLEANIQVGIDTLRLLRQFVGAPEEVRDADA